MNGTFIPLKFFNFGELIRLGLPLIITIKVGYMVG